MLSNTSDLIAWVQTVPPEPGIDLVIAGVLHMTTSESVFARTSGNWYVSTFLSVQQFNKLTPFKVSLFAETHIHVDTNK